MNWLWANKEWVFSGVGVAVISALIALFFRRRSGGHFGAISADRGSSVVGSPVASGSNISQTVSIVTIPPSPVPPPRKSYSGKPTPMEIHEHLDSLPIFQQGAAKDSYVGLQVCWPATLYNLHEIRNARGKTHTLVTRFEGTGPLIETEINIDSFPRLKISRDGALRISGTIQSLGNTGWTYSLKDVDVEFEE